MITTAWWKERRSDVAERLQRAEATGPHDPIWGSRDEYRACLAELDAIIADGERTEGAGS